MAFTFNFGNLADRVQAENAVFNRTLEDFEYAALGGDLIGDATLNIEYNEPWLHNNGYSRIRIRTVSRLGTIVVRLIPGRFDYSSCNVRHPGRGTGALILHRIATAASDHGFASLTGVGERAVDPTTGKLTSWGYYASPRHGFDAPIPPNAPARPAALAQCATVLELLAQPGGQQWWLQNGIQLPHIEFDLAPNSASWQTLLARI